MGSGKLISGGQDHTVKTWDSITGQLTRTYNGCLRSILDLNITNYNKSIIAADSLNNLYVWDTSSGRVKQALMGYKDKVSAIDVSRFSTCHVVQVMTELLKIGIAITLSFSQVIGTRYYLVWLDKRFVRVMLTDIKIMGYTNGKKVKIMGL